MKPVVSVALERSTYDRIRAALNRIPDKVAKKELRAGMAKAGRYMARAVKQEAAKYRQTGTLQASIASKVATGRDGRVMAIIGPARVSKTRTTKGGRHKRATRAEIKAKEATTLRYAHLLEFGHRQVGHAPAKHDTGQRVSGRRFMTRAFERARQEAEDIVANHVAAAANTHH